MFASRKAVSAEALLTAALPAHEELGLHLVAKVAHKTVLLPPAREAAAAVAAAPERVAAAEERAARKAELVRTEAADEKAAEAKVEEASEGRIPHDRDGNARALALCRSRRG